MALTLFVRALVIPLAFVVFTLISCLDGAAFAGIDDLLYYLLRYYVKANFKNLLKTILLLAIIFLLSSGLCLAGDLLLTQTLTQMTYQGYPLLSKASLCVVQTASLFSFVLNLEPSLQGALMLPRSTSARSTGVLGVYLFQNSCY